jgi:tetratricopeptide (TPR) repeat protein
MMSTEDDDEAADTCCASCGITAVDEIKLKKCDGGCDLVKYCSDGCQEKHREQHDAYCKKRAAELRDRDLFAQPDESHLGECPICCLPLSLDTAKWGYMGCCSQLICLGCHFFNGAREIKAGLEKRCAFCREPLEKSDEECEKEAMERVKANCPVATREMGNKYDQEGDHKTALDYFTKAAELGDSDAHYNLSIMYTEGEGVDKDEKKKIFHMEEAAIGGHPDARHNLGVYELDNGRFDRAKKHFIIAANLGYNKSLTGLKQLYAGGHASKEDYANALRAHQAAVDATKSEDREVAEFYVSKATVEGDC